MLDIDNNKIKDIWNKKKISMTISNPFYCITVHEIFCHEHETLVSEKEWIDACSNLIDDIGKEEFLKCLLENLRGNYLIEGHEYEAN